MTDHESITTIDSANTAHEAELNAALAEAVRCLEQIHACKWRVSVRHDLRMVTILGPRPKVEEAA